MNGQFYGMVVEENEGSLLDGRKLKSSVYFNKSGVNKYIGNSGLVDSEAHLMVIVQELYRSASLPSLERCSSADLSSFEPNKIMGKNSHNWLKKESPEVANP